MSEDIETDMAMAVSKEVMVVFVDMGNMTVIIDMGITAVTVYTGITAVTVDILVILFDRVERKDTQTTENPSGLDINSEASN